jgi:heptaprenyl diphosphate synthase
MTVLKKTDLLSTAGVSIAGGVFHNLGQILVAMALLGTAEIGYYMVVLAVTGILAGLFTGLCGAFLIGRLREV